MASLLCALLIRRHTSKGGGGGHASQPLGKNVLAGAKKEPESELRVWGR